MRSQTMQRRRGRGRPGGGRLGVCRPIAGLALAVLLAGGVGLTGCAPAGDGEGDGSGALSAVTVLTPGEARELIEREGDLFVLSVCHKWEFDYYRIPGSAMVPHHLLADWLAGESLYEEINRNRRPAKDQPVLLYCSTGGRTKKASALMARKGYERVYVLGGGMRDWMRAGIPYEKTTLSGSAPPEEKQGVSGAAGENGSGEG